MRVIVNGKAKEMDEGCTVADVVQLFDLAPPRVAVELNEELIPRARYGEVRLKPDDRIEIVAFVGGGLS